MNFGNVFFATVKDAQGRLVQICSGKDLPQSFDEKTFFSLITGDISLEDISFEEAIKQQ